MKKQLAIIAIVLCLPFFAFLATAQISPLTYSENFPEHNGSTFIKALKNGNTMLMLWRDKEFTCKIYGTNKKKISETKQEVTSLELPLPAYDIKSVIEINNEVIFFIVGAPKRKEGRTPILVRIIIDAQTGKLKKSEEIHAQPPLPKGAGYAVVFGDVGLPDFCVEKDPYSDYYAVVVSCTFAKEMKDRIQVIHYDPSHNQISNAFFKVPAGYNQIAFRGFCVKADKYVVMLTEPYVREKRSEGNKILLSKLSKGSKEFETKEIKYENKFEAAFCVMSPDPKTDNISLIMRIKLAPLPKQKWYKDMYDVFILPVNGEKFETGALFHLNYEKVSAQYAALVGSKKSFEPYNALIQDYLYDQAGNRLFLTEQTESITDSKGLSTTARLRDMGITAVNKEGKEVYGLHIPNIHAFRRDVTTMIYYQYRFGQYGPYTNYNVGPGFVKVVAGKKYNYIFFNDTQENRTKPSTDKMSLVYGFGSLDTYCYKIDNKTGAVTQALLFDKQPEKGTTRICFFENSMFNEETGEFVSVYLDIAQNGDKHSGLVWFKLD